MILGLGIDLCPVDRMERILNRQGESFCRRVFTAGERQYAESGAHPGERYAARFAAKEATIKALGGFDGMRWQEMEVERTPSGAPALRLHGAAKARADAMGVSGALLSLTHTVGMAAAVVILEGADHVE